jgi:hypothetical protein
VLRRGSCDDRGQSGDERRGDEEECVDRSPVAAPGLSRRQQGGACVGKRPRMSHRRCDDYSSESRSLGARLRLHAVLSAQAEALPACRSPSESVQSARVRGVDVRTRTATARLQFPAVCPDGTSFSRGAPATPATITSTSNLKSVAAAGSGIARDNLGGTHQVSFDVTWTAVGPLETTVNGPGSKRQQREATATGQVIFDGVVLVDGAANPPDSAGAVHPRGHGEMTT